MNQLKTLGPQIKELRTDRGLTLQALANQSGLSKSFLSEIENGKRLPRLETINKIAKAMKLRVYIEWE